MITDIDGETIRVAEQLTSSQGDLDVDFASVLD